MGQAITTEMDIARYRRLSPERKEEVMAWVTAHVGDRVVHVDWADGVATVERRGRDGQDPKGLYRDRVEVAEPPPWLSWTD